MTQNASAPAIGTEIRANNHEPLIAAQTELTIGETTSTNRNSMTKARRQFPAERQPARN